MDREMIRELESREAALTVQTIEGARAEAVSSTLAIIAGVFIGGKFQKWQNSGKESPNNETGG